MKVKIKHSDHSDIKPGDIGKVIGETVKGYAVEFTKPFYAANKLQGNPEIDTRTIYFTKKQVEILPDDPKGNSPCTDSTGEILPDPIS